MKKTIVSIVCFVLCVFSVNAIEVSAGLGADVGFIFTSTDTNIPEPAKSQLNAQLDNMDTTRWGISAFFDIQYVEANLGFKFVNFSYGVNGYEFEETDTFFNLGMKLKYPIKVTESINFFPLVGFDYSIFSSGKAKNNAGNSESIKRDDISPSDLIDRFSINLGIGGDFYANQNVYIRGEINYAFLLNTESQELAIKQIESAGYNLSVIQNGPVFKLALGYRFL